MVQQIQSRLTDAEYTGRRKALIVRPGFMHRRAKARRSSNGYGIHVLGIFKDVDGRDKPGHDRIR